MQFTNKRVFKKKALWLEELTKLFIELSFGKEKEHVVK